MTTEVVMVRELFGCEISQKSKTAFFSATDLLRAGNKWRAENGMGAFDYRRWLYQDSTQEFKRALEAKYGQVWIAGRGRGHHTWVHPIMFIELALSISPELKIEVYEWLYDHLLAYRNDSGESYKKMAGALYDKYSNKRNFQHFIADVADRIRIACKVEDWQHADEAQLKRRDKMHDAIATLVDIIPPEDAVRIATTKN